MLYRILFIVLNVILVTLAEHKNEESFCAEQQNCTSCLQTINCIWCSDNISPPVVRCVTRERYEKEGELWCGDKSKAISDSSEVEFVENRPISNGKNRDPVQVQPQKIRLQLRKGEEKHVSLKYSQAEDYPVDLYYLMDLSASMEPYRDQLSELGFQLADAMRKITSNFRLGFGSFVDKVVLPMTHTQPEKLVTPCILAQTSRPCATPYGYRNQMSLTEDISLFKIRVQQASVSGNLDAPEGGLDAMLQAMLAGIVEPNDGLCHLDEDGYYTFSLFQDYPSISQINKIASENNINIIFAVPIQRNLTYQLLTNSISGSSIGLLDNESNNVVALIRKEYEKLVNSVTLTDNATRSIDIKYFSKCLKETAEPKERRECGGLRVGNTVEFDVVIKARNCPENRAEWQQSIQVRPTGLHESLTIDLQLICDCPCDRGGHPSNVPNSPICRGNGTLACGVCYCNEGFYGKSCECKGKIHDSNEVEDCSSNGDDQICSGHGTCKCGVCDCNKRNNPREVFYGKYCECDNFSCKRNHEKLVCGGRGKCECGTCNCLPGWTGETCDCKETNSTCIPTDSTSEICSGHGDCICGKCHCQQNGNKRYLGQFCEECPTCPDKLCEDFKDCVECVAHKSGPLAGKEQCGGLCQEIDIVKIVEEESTDNETGAQVCRVPGDGGCTFVFKYTLYRQGVGGDMKIYEISAQESRTCPEPVNAMGVATGVIVSTVILGLLVLLIWKVFTEIHDKREFAKFEKERAEAKWHREENPLYKQATTTFTNPTFKSLSAYNYEY
ncbi:integrin beta-PS-like isoform X2 [Belonocnema kinseyi]|uniref:integrin beta-PS-like isoform X2 n=1 Tax=Belonocnema kinseyi TaxID=2817044 RepID=UPI00143CD591|nr:integrin beta-PS-like isoform X2 [Belonocnema kinseyi]